METFISIIHLIVALLLIFLVLVQDSKGGAMGGMLGGGGSNSLMGATGATSFLVKLTRYVAIAFAATCIYLTISSSSGTKSVVDGYVPPVTADGEAVDTEPAKTDSASPDSSKAEDK